MSSDLPEIAIRHIYGKRAVSAQFIARARNYSEDHKAWDAAEWSRRKLDVTPTIKLAAAVFGVPVARVTAVRRLLDQRDRRRRTWLAQPELPLRAAE
jgi:hypothetical protein